MFLLCRVFMSPHPLRRRVGKQTPAAPELQLPDVVWSDESFFPDARAAQPSEHEDLLWLVISRNCLGTCLSRNLRNVESCFRHIFEHSSACGNMVIFSPAPLSSSVATTRGVMVSGIVGACDVAPSLHFVEPWTSALCPVAQPSWSRA